MSSSIVPKRIKYWRCSGCGGPKPPSYSRLCRPCYIESRKGIGISVKPKLSIRSLTDEQRELYELIMLNRRWTRESHQEALDITVKAKNLEAEAEWWRASDCESTHQRSTTALLADYARV